MYKDDDVNVDFVGLHYAIFSVKLQFYLQYWSRIFSSNVNYFNQRVYTES